MTRSGQRRLRLCHVGGEDVHARIPILNALSDQFDVFAAGSDGADRFTQAGIEFWKYTLTRGVSPLGDYKTTKELTRHFREAEPDIINAFDTKPAIYAMQAGKRASVPVRIRTITGLGYLFSEQSLATRLLTPVWTRLQHRAGAQASWTVFQNEDDRRLFVERRLVRPEKSSIIAGSGVDIDRMLGSALPPGELDELRYSLGLREGPVILMAARLVKQKGVREFIEAASILSDCHPDANFLLAGAFEGEGHQAVSRQELSHAAPFLRHVGFRTDIPALLQLADIVVLPTYYREGVPRILMEAALMRAAIVTTDMPGCRDVIDGGRLGWLTPPRDGAALARTIRTVLEMAPATRADLVDQCAVFVSANFSLESVAWEYRQLYVELAARAGLFGQGDGG